MVDWDFINDIIDWEECFIINQEVNYTIDQVGDCIIGLVINFFIMEYSIEFEDRIIIMVVHFNLQV